MSPNSRYELGSGMRKMMKYSGAYVGADPELVEGDVFRMVIRVPEFGEKMESATGTQQVTRQVAKMLAACVGELSRTELMQAVGIKDRVSFSRNYLDPALADNLIEMTQPDSPNSPTQEYRLTAKSATLLEEIKK